MKVIIIFTAVLSLFIFACSTSTTPNREGNLTFINNTSGNATVTLSGSNPINILPNHSVSISVNTSKSTNVYFTYTGEFIDSGSDNVTVSTNQTTTYNLYADCGVLRIDNSTDADLLVSFTGKAKNTLSPNSYDTYKIATGINQSASSSFDFDGLYVFPDNASLTINSDELTTYTVNPTGGAIRINNNSSITIQHLYLSPTSNNTWGSDALSNNLYPGDSAIWTVGAGFWDIKVVDDFGNAYFIYDEHVSLNETLPITYLDKKAAAWITIDKKLDGIGNFKPAVRFLLNNQ